jgi:hypothetical protein
MEWANTYDICKECGREMYYSGYKENGADVFFCPNKKCIVNKPKKV